MKKFCKDVKEHAIKIIDYEKKTHETRNHETDEENKSYHKQKVCYICNENLALILMIKRCCS